MIDKTILARLQRGLPPLRGRLLWAYRLLWLAFALGAVATLAAALTDPTTGPLIIGLRAVKSLIVGAAATVLFWRRQRDPVAAILSLAFLCWTITSSFDFTTAAVLPMLLDRLRFLLFVLALLLFPDARWRPRWTLRVAIASCLVFLLGVVEAVGIISSRMFLPLAIGCVLAAIAALLQRFRRTEDETHKQQLKWVSLGLVTGVGLILTARASAALSVPNVAFEALFQLGIVLVALGFLVPLLRYRLYDAESFISRSAAYAALTATLLATFAGSEALLEALGQRYLGSSIGQVSGAVAAAIAAVLFTPLNDRINVWADRHFQRDLLQLRTELPDLLADVPYRWTPADVGRAMLPRIMEAVHATHGAILLQEQLIASEGVGAVSLKLELRCGFGELHGWLLLGPRPDGSDYGHDDVEALREVVPALCRALMVSSERETFRLLQRQHRSALQNQILNLAVRLAQIEPRSRLANIDIMEA